MGNKTPVEAYLALDAKATSAEDMITKYQEKAETNRWEQCRIVHEAVTSGEYTQGAFAEAVGKHKSTIHRQARVWKTWGDVAPAQRPTYTEAYAEAQNRPTGAERTAQMTAGNVRNMPAADKAKVARELLADPEVADEIEDDVVGHVASRPSTSAKARRKLDEIDPELDEQSRRAADRAAESSRQGRKSQPMLQALVVEGELAKLLRLHAEALESVKLLDVEALDQIETALRESLSEKTDKLVASAQLLQLAVSGTTEVDWDSEFAKMGGAL